MYQGYYVTMTLTNHRAFQNRPTLDAKKMHFCSSESRESRIFGISALKTIVLKNKTKLFFDLQLVNYTHRPATVAPAVFNVTEKAIARLHRVPVEVVDLTTGRFLCSLLQEPSLGQIWPTASLVLLYNNKF